MCACYCFDFECIVHLDILQLQVHVHLLYNIYICFHIFQLEWKQRNTLATHNYLLHTQDATCSFACKRVFFFFLNFFLVRSFARSLCLCFAIYICKIYGMQNEQEKANNIHLVIYLFTYLPYLLILAL